MATAARAGYVLKMFAVDPAYQGGDVLGALSSALIVLGRWAGHDSFLVFTRPEHVLSFQYCQFRLLVTTGDVALLECGGGLDRYLDAHRHLRRDGANGAVVINGNPFTRGHQYLVEAAAAQVDTLYVFIVREDRSVFPFAVRHRLAAESIAHVKNAVLLDTSRYAVSAATFPSYFLRKNDEKARLQMEVDVRLFAAHIAPAFGVTRRFVGHEPYCETTGSVQSGHGRVPAVLRHRPRRGAPHDRRRQVHQRDDGAPGAGGGESRRPRATRAAGDAGLSRVGRGQVDRAPPAGAGFGSRESGFSVTSPTMNISKSSTAGTMQSSDLVVQVEPADRLDIQIDSTVKKQFEHLIRARVEAVLKKHAVTGARVKVSDRGALDYAIEARVETALTGVRGLTGRRQCTMHNAQCTTCDRVSRWPGRKPEALSPKASLYGQALIP